MPMKAKFEIHPIQAKILRTLLFKPEATFSELNTDKTPTDQFNFHLKSLVDSKILAKTNGKKYVLTPTGKEFANRFDTDKLVLERQAKITMVIGCRREKGKKIEYLISKRLKNPYFGFHGFITGKIRWGETVLEAAARELMEETGVIAGKLKIVGIGHKMDYSDNSEMLEDKYFFVIRAEDLNKEPTLKAEGVENIWVEREKIKNLPKLFPDMELRVAQYESKSFSFSEKKYEVSEY